MPTIFQDHVSVNGIEFNTAAAISAQPGSIKVAIDSIEGWRATSDLDTVLTKIGFADGEIPAARFPARARHMIIEGYLYCLDRATAESVMDSLLGSAFPNNKDIELIRHEPVPKSMLVRVSGAIETLQSVEEGFRFQVPVVAPDPYKYSLSDIPAIAIGISGLSGGGVRFPLRFPMRFMTASTGQSNVMLLTNQGNAFSPFVATLAGPIDQGWRIENTETGDLIAFDIGLASTDALVIDTKKETARLNGYSVDGLLRGDFFRLRPGGNAIRLYGTYNPTASLSVSAKSAWRN